jgi:hypothetical protein
MASSTSSSIDWSDITKKEARGSNDEDLGEVQEVGQNYVLVQRGMVNKKKFYIPRDLAESYDGTVLRFRISEEDAESRFLRIPHHHHRKLGRKLQCQKGTRL